MMENIAVIIGICCVVGVIGFGIYQFIKLEKDKQLEISKRRTKYFWIMILGIFLIFVTGIFQ